MGNHGQLCRVTWISYSPYSIECNWSTGKKYFCGEMLSSFFFSPKLHDRVTRVGNALLSIYIMVLDLLSKLPFFGSGGVVQQAISYNSWVIWQALLLVPILASWVRWPRPTCNTCHFLEERVGEVAVTWCISTSTSTPTSACPPPPRFPWNTLSKTPAYPQFLVF